MLAYAGGYTSDDRSGRGKGIQVFRTAPLGEAWAEVQSLSAGENPSLLRLGPGETMLYAVHGGRTAVSAYAVEASTGLLSSRGSEACGGVNPVDLGVWPGQRFLVIANYTSGTVAVLPLAADGTLLPACAQLALERPGHPGPAMPHGVTFDRSGRFVLIPDKGLDGVFVFTLGAGEALVQAGFGACDPGSGPRHCTFHPTRPVLYVVNELACSVQSFDWSAADGGLTPRQSVPSLPPGAVGFAAEIAVAGDGRSLYASNRGHDSIAHIPIDPTTGRMGAATCTPCGGAEPRFFALSPDGRVLHVANQGSDQIVSFPLDEAGRLGPGRVSATLGSPTALCFRRAP